MKLIQLLLVGQNPWVCADKLGFVERVSKSLFSLINFLFNLPLIFGHLVLDQYIGPVSFLGVLVVD